jgi:hypothetical protein
MVLFPGETGQSDIGRVENASEYAEVMSTATVCFQQIAFLKNVWSPSVF